MKLAWGSQVSPEFRRRAIAAASEIGCDPSALMSCIAFETGQTFSPSIRNAQSGATGLIQFMPKTAIGLGTTTSELARMTAVEQMAYVVKYFKQPYLAKKGSLATLEDLYMAILWPDAIGRPLDYVLFAEGSNAYLQNKGLDVDKDGRTTKKEACAKVRSLLTTGLLKASEEVPVLDKATLQPKEKTVLPVLLPALLSLLAPKLQDKLGKVTGNPTGAQQLFDTLLDAGSRLVEVPKEQPIQVVAKLQEAAVQNPEVVKKLEETAEDFLMRIGPVIEKIDAMERAAFQDTEASRNAAAARAKTEEYDLAPILARNSLTWVGFALVSTTGIVLYMVSHSLTVPELLLGLIVQLATWIMAKSSTLFDYRFGTSRSSGIKDTARDAVTMELARRGRDG